MDPAEGLARAGAAIRRLVEAHHDRPSLVTRIACEIGAEIVEGVRAAGEDLNSVTLARRYGASRTPVREALMLLEKEGLVEIPPRRRPRVAPFDIGQIRETYRVRAALYEHMAGDLVNRATDAEIAGLRPLLARMEAAFAEGDVDAYAWANVDFYERVTQIAHNRTVKRMLDTLLLRTLPLRRLSLSQPGRVARSLEDHRRLVRAYEDRDANLAAALVRSHNAQALAVLEARLSEVTPDAIRRRMA